MILSVPPTLVNHIPAFSTAAVPLVFPSIYRKLEINVKTVSKYWDATPDEFAAMRQRGKKRTKKLAHYRDIILKC